MIYTWWDVVADNRLSSMSRLRQIHKRTSSSSTARPRTQPLKLHLTGSPQRGEILQLCWSISMWVLHDTIHDAIMLIFVIDCGTDKTSSRYLHCCISGTARDSKQRPSIWPREGQCTEKGAKIVWRVKRRVLCVVLELCCWRGLWRNHDYWRSYRLYSWHGWKGVGTAVLEYKCVYLQRFFVSLCIHELKYKVIRTVKPKAISIRMQWQYISTISTTCHSELAIPASICRKSSFNYAAMKKADLISWMTDETQSCTGISNTEHAFGQSRRACNNKNSMIRWLCPLLSNLCWTQQLQSST